MAKFNVAAVKRASGAKPAPAKSTKSSMSPNEHVSVSVRKISNGYIVSKSCDGPKGYTHTEEFCAEKPTIDIPAVKKAAGTKR